MDAIKPVLFNQALASLELSRDDLEQKQLHFRDLDKLLLRLRQLGMPDITLRYYRQIQLSDFGLAGYAVASSRNLKDAVERSIRFQQLTTDRFLIHQQLEQQGQRLVLTPVVAQDHLHERIDIGEEFISGYWRMLELLLGDSVNLAHVSLELDFAKPDYWPRGSANFPCQLEFKRNRCAVSFPTEWLHFPLRTAAGEVAELCERQCEKLLKAHQPDNIVARVQRALIYGLKVSASLEEVSDWLHIPARTLRARIYRENTSFRQIALDLRMRLAHQYLTSTSMQVKEIAYLLGYSQPATFHTAFCRYYGQSPGNYRSTIISSLSKQV
ncbi:AraC family transcriptional regulator ligand-binding domain-containing protein [Amphritea sp. HPY]|uniref:helix-turn-helix transcriptional regulator n=1 Tax=Amphritea sp. HPY TaxID=3421652 RepID=UPI003D7E89A0